MSASLFQTAIVTKAESAYREKDWKKACKYYDNYFRKVYKSPNDPNKEMDLEDALKLCHYAESLFEQMKAESTNNKFDQDDVETVVEYFLSARKIIEKQPDKSKIPIDKYIDIFDYLGQVALQINQFKQAQQEFKKGYQKAVENNCNWRIRLSLLFEEATALEMQEKPRKASETIQKGLEIIDEESAKNPNEDDEALLKEFKEQLQKKIDELKEDIKEQDENKDTLKESSDEKEEEEEGEEEEEEEEAKDEEINEEDGKPSEEKEQNDKEEEGENAKVEN